MSNSYRAYYQTSVQTSDQVGLILMLYDGALRFMKKAIVKIEDGDVESAHNYMTRSKDIIGELLATLRLEEGGEIAENLKELYLYAFNRIVEANLKKDPEILREVIRFIEPLRQGWYHLKQQQEQEKQSQQGRKIRVQG